MVDCGMEQGVNVFENAPLPVLPGQIDAVFLTHAHIDHSGMLPKLYKDGFRGKVYATQATENLCRIMLMDSANIQMSDAEWINRKAARAGRASIEPVYTLSLIHIYPAAISAVRSATIPPCSQRTRQTEWPKRSCWRF